MLLEFDVVTTLFIAIIALLTGRLVIAHVGVLKRYNIPEPVVGGLLAALLITGLRLGADVEVVFDMAMQGPLMLAFFATIGLNADVRQLIQGGRTVLLFLLVVSGMLLAQNVIGLSAAWAMDLHPLNGLLTGSITMLGGHGTGAAYAGRFIEIDNLQGAMEMAMACATFGLVLGGIVGGPVAQHLISRYSLKGPSHAKADPTSADGSDASKPPVNANRFIETMLLVLVCILVGRWLSDALQNAYVTLPGFVWTLFTGALLRNTLTLTGLREIHAPSLDLLGAIALSLFLSMALLSLRLWELVSLALPILGIIGLQTLAAVIYIRFVTFRAMGSNYDAAVLCAGHCGLALGATPTAIANMQAITAKYGASPQAFLIIPIVGAFLIDITNALFIQAFLALPIFGF